MPSVLFTVCFWVFIVIEFVALHQDVKNTGLLHGSRPNCLCFAACCAVQGKAAQELWWRGWRLYSSPVLCWCVCVCAHSNPTSQHFHISPSRGSWPKTKKGVFYSNNDPLFTQAWPTTALKKGPFPCLQLSELGRESRRTVVTGSKSGLSAGKRGEKDRGRRRGGERESGSGFLASWCSARLVKALIQPAFSCYSTGWKPLLWLRLYDSKTGFPAKKRTN